MTGKAGYKAIALPFDDRSSEKVRGMSGIEKVRNFWETHVNNEYYTRFDRTSGEYFDDIARKRYAYHYHLPELFDRMGRGEGKKLLEIGCGIGIDTVSLAGRGFDVTAVDLTETAIEIARKRAADQGLVIDYRTGNCEELAFPDDSFDVVYSFGVIHHTPGMAGAVREIRRVLKPGGIAYIMIYSKYSLVNFVHVAGRLPYESPKDLKDHCPVVIRSTENEVRELFGEFSGLEVHSDYPFTYGMRFFSRFIPVFAQRGLGRLIGWHLMIEARK